MFENLISALKAEKRTIVFTEGEDARILEAASRLKKDGLMDSILVGNVEAVKAAAAKGGFDIEGMEIIDPATYPEMDAMVEKMVELRKGKMSAEDCKAALAKGNYFGTMLVKMGKADALLGGATYSTEVAIETANTAKAFGIDPKVAVLSFSTKGSGKGGTVALSREATEYAKEMNPELAIDGELQFDAAVSPVVAATKCKGSPVAGQANTFIFPSIEAGNIGYKIAQRLGGSERTHQRPVPRLQRRRGLPDGYHHRRPEVISA